MPKPQRCRRICQEPKHIRFFSDNKDESTVIKLTIDEFEVIRLVDYEKKTHQECAKHMDISRTTVTEIYERARFKIADCLINGQQLIIEGGNYRICDGSAFPYCKKEGCKQKEDYQTKIIEKGVEIMRIAVTYANEEIFQHFGHSEQFKFYDVEDNKIVSSQVVDTNGSGHGALAGFLTANKVDVLICGGIGGGAKNALNQAGIKLYGGVSGNADRVVSDFLANKLTFNPDVQCSHHEHGENHTCGDHGCGKHSCH